MGVFSIGKVLIDSLFRKPATLMYPVIPREWEEMTRGAVGIDVDGCVLCGMCQRACPTNAITVDRKEGTWSIERMNCVQCRGCVDNCPPNCLIMEQKYTEPGVEKVVDTFNVPKKEKGKKDAPAGDGAKATKAAPAAADGDGPLTCDLETCVYCGLCAKECPVDALKVERKPDKIWEVDQDECISCGACIDKCPKDSLSFGGAEAADAPAEKDAPKAEEKSEAKAEEKAEATAAAGETGLVCDVDSCVFCGACADACPVDAIEVGEDSWKVDKDTCIECGACVDQCPADCLKMVEDGAAEEAAPAEETKAAPAGGDDKAANEDASKSEAKAEKKSLREALEMDEETKEKVEGYIAQVKEALVSEFKLAEDAAAKAIEEKNLKGQLARFPYLLKKDAKDTAEHIKE